jgi:uncharacterized repeat protein (TIGR01451 family)
MLRDVIPSGMGNVNVDCFLCDTGLEYEDYPVPTVYTETTVVSLTTRYWEYDVTVDEGRTAGEILNSFLYSVDGGPWLSTDPVTVTVQSPLVNSVKGVDKGTAYVDDVLLYTITLNNDARAEDVTATVVDTIPEYTSFITGSQGVSYTNGQLMWTGTVAAQDSEEITFTVQVASVVPQYPTPIVNVATVDDGINPPFDLDPATTIVQSKVEMLRGWICSLPTPAACWSTPSRSSPRAAAGQRSGTRYRPTPPTSLAR